MAGAEDKDMEWILRNEEIDWTLINSPEGLGGKNSLELSPMQVEEDIYNYTPTKDTHCVKPIATNRSVNMMRTPLSPFSALLNGEMDINDLDAASALHNLSRTSPSCSERGRGSDTFPSLEANDNIPEPQKISNPKWQKRTEEVLAQKNEIDNNSLGEIDYSLSNGKITVYDTSHPTPTSIKYCYSSAGRSGVRFAPVSVATVMNLLNPSLLVDLKVKGGRGVNKETVRAPSLRSSSGSSQLDRDECIQVLFEKVLRAHFIQNGLRKLNTETNVIENGQRNVLSDLNFYPGGIQSKFASNSFPFNPRKKESLSYKFVLTCEHKCPPDTAKDAENCAKRNLLICGRQLIITFASDFFFVEEDSEGNERVLINEGVTHVPVYCYFPDEIDASSSFALPACLHAFPQSNKNIKMFDKKIILNAVEQYGGLKKAKMHLVTKALEENKSFDAPPISNGALYQARSKERHTPFDEDNRGNWLIWKDNMESMLHRRYKAVEGGDELLGLYTQNGASLVFSTFDVHPRLSIGFGPPSFSTNFCQNFKVISVDYSESSKLGHSLSRLDATKSKVKMMQLIVAVTTCDGPRLVFVGFTDSQASNVGASLLENYLNNIALTVGKGYHPVPEVINIDGGANVWKIIRKVFLQDWDIDKYVNERCLFLQNSGSKENEKCAATELCACFMHLKFLIVELAHAKKSLPCDKELRNKWTILLVNAYEAVMAAGTADSSLDVLLKSDYSTEIEKALSACVAVVSLLQCETLSITSDGGVNFIPKVELVISDIFTNSDLCKFWTNKLNSKTPAELMEGSFSLQIKKQVSTQPPHDEKNYLIIDFDKSQKVKHQILDLIFNKKDRDKFDSVLKRKVQELNKSLNEEENSSSFDDRWYNDKGCKIISEQHGNSLDLDINKSRVRFPIVKTNGAANVDNPVCSTHATNILMRNVTKKVFHINSSILPKQKSSGQRSAMPVEQVINSMKNHTVKHDNYSNFVDGGQHFMNTLLNLYEVNDIDKTNNSNKRKISQKHVEKSKIAKLTKFEDAITAKALQTDNFAQSIGFNMNSNAISPLKVPAFDKSVAKKIEILQEAYGKGWSDSRLEPFAQAILYMVESFKFKGEVSTLKEKFIKLPHNMFSDFKRIDLIINDTKSKKKLANDKECCIVLNNLIDVFTSSLKPKDRLNPDKLSSMRNGRPWQLSHSSILKLKNKLGLVFIDASEKGGDKDEVEDEDVGEEEEATEKGENQVHFNKENLIVSV